MGTITAKLLSWTPISVIIVLFAFSDMVAMLWYVFHFMTPPNYLITVAVSLLTGSAISFGNAQGSASTMVATNVANANNNGVTPPTTT